MSSTLKEMAGLSWQLFLENEFGLTEVGEFCFEAFVLSTMAEDLAGGFHAGEDVLEFGGCSGRKELEVQLEEEAFLGDEGRRTLIEDGGDGGADEGEAGGGHIKKCVSFQGSVFRGENFRASAQRRLTGGKGQGQG
jgi:hypothetical protein